MVAGSALLLALGFVTTVVTELVVLPSLVLPSSFFGPALVRLPGTCDAGCCRLAVRDAAIEGFAGLRGREWVLAGERCEVLNGERGSVTEL